MGLNILALDCGEHTGFATRINGIERSGTEHWKHKTNESPGMKYLRFDWWLREMDGIGNFDLIVYEKPCHLQGNAIESMNGYITGIQRFISQRDLGGKKIDYEAIAPKTGKKFIKGKVPKSDVDELTKSLEKSLSPSAFKALKTKIECIAWFKYITKREPADDNEADAYALLKYIENEIGETNG